MGEKKEKDIQFVELAIKHEHAMAMHYETFYNLVPCCEEFWKGLSNEELQHGQRLGVLLREIKLGNAELAPTRHDSTVIEASLLSLQKRIEVWNRDGVAIKEAFEYALLLEGGMIEDAIFEPHEGDSELASQILWEMRTGTNDHFSRLREEYEKHSYGAGFIRHLRATFKSFLLTDDQDN